jgi:hypothetical protein
MSDAVDSFYGALRGIPNLTGALCKGEWELFDDTELPDLALSICAQCPALAGCSPWFESLPKRHQPPGVIAGRINKRRDATL